MIAKHEKRTQALTLQVKEHGATTQNSPKPLTTTTTNSDNHRKVSQERTSDLARLK